ncbi:hypothetical protein BDW68DRAFT_171806 [Aspergillus falconensis]
MPPSRPLLYSYRSVLRTPSSRRYLLRPSNVRYVKVIKRPWSRGFIANLLLCGVATYFWSSFVPVRKDDTSSNTSSNMDSRKPAERHSVPETTSRNSIKAVFIPTGWTQLQEGKLYAATDPEWKAFVKISKSPEKLQSLKDELTSIVLSEASQSSLLLRMLGPPFTVSGKWLLHHFPSRAPKSYHRTGLEFSGTGVSWVQKPAASETICEIIRPSYLALAVLDAYSVLWERFLAHFNATSPVSERACLPDSYMDFKALDKLGDAPQSESPSTHIQPSSILATLRWLPLPKLGPGSDLYDATQVFKKRINECQRSDSRAYRQGTFFIRGPVSLKGSQGSCRIQVEGEYDPVTSEWVSVSMHLNDLTFFNQQPFGRK